MPKKIKNANKEAKVAVMKVKKQEEKKQAKIEKKKSTVAVEGFKEKKTMTKKTLEHPLKGQNPSIIEMRVGEIVKIDNHKTDKSMFVCDVNVGEKRDRVIAIKIRADCKDKDTLIGKKVVVVCNVPRADVGGVKTDGFPLVAREESVDGEEEIGEWEEKLKDRPKVVHGAKKEEVPEVKHVVKEKERKGSLFVFGDDAKVGELVTYDGMESVPFLKQVSPQQLELLLPFFYSNEECDVCWFEHKFIPSMKTISPNLMVSQ